MKKYLISAVAALAMLVPTAASARFSEHGPFFVEQFDENGCAMAIDAPNGAFFMMVDTNASATIAATRPGLVVASNEPVSASMTVILKDGGQTVIPLDGVGMYDGEDGGVIIPIDNGYALMQVLDLSTALSIEVEGQKVAGVVIDENFLAAANAMLTCTGSLLSI